MRWRFDRSSFLISVIIFFIEVLIAKFVNDAFIRPYGGDILVVILIYYFVKSFVQVKPFYLVLGVLLFAYMVEVGQYFRMVEVLGLQDYKVMRIVLGTSFSWIDILCYTVGAIICYLIDRKEK